MNDVTVSNPGAIMSASDLMDGLSKFSAGIQGSNDKPYLKLDRNDGAFLYGQENIEIEPDSVWAVNVSTFMHGMVAWTNPPKAARAKSENVGEVMVPFNQPMPRHADLPEIEHEFPFEWDVQMSVELQCVKGEDTGIVVVYKNTSMGMKNAVKKLITEIMQQLQVDKSKVVPLVEMFSDNYPNKRYGGVTWFPIFTVVDWADYNKLPDPDTIGSDETSDDDTAELASSADAGSESVESDDDDEGAPEASPATPRRRKRSTVAKGDAKSTSKKKVTKKKRQSRRRSRS